MYAHYSQVRVVTNRLDHETKDVLEKVLGVIEDPSVKKDATLGWHCLVLARINLALVLHTLGIEPERTQQ